MKQITIISMPLKLALLGVAALLVACSSGGDSAVSTSTVSGYVVAAPVSGAQVRVLDGNGNVVAGPVDTDGAGRYTLSITNVSLAQDLIIKSTGGTFTDEATMKNASAGEMFAYVSANALSDGDNVCATPGSSVIANLVMNHNKTLTQAQLAFANAFGYSPDVSVIPADATVPGSQADDNSKLAGFRAAAFSQLAMDLGLPENSQFEMFAALAQDLSDDVLDGVDAAGAVAIGSTGFMLEADIQNRFATALLNFHASANNQTALTNDKIGNLPFSKIVLTPTYKIEYVPGMMSSMEGKATFQFHISDRITGDDVNGLTPMLMPMMHMATMNHSSPMPVPAISEDGNGLYSATIYYLMASQMMDGTSMGYWDLMLTVVGEPAHFYPAIMMAMGDTVKTKLKGQSDVIKDMMGMDENRNYYIFKDSLIATGPMGTGPYSFTMFIAAKESMMAFPAVIDGNTLQSGMGGTPLDINAISVNISVNGGVAVAANDNGDGSWVVSLDMNDGEVNQLDVELVVNGERKTSDGTAGGLDATFMLTAGGM